LVPKEKRIHFQNLKEEIKEEMLHRFQKPTRIYFLLAWSRGMYYRNRVHRLLALRKLSKGIGSIILGAPRPFL